jgi:hypothetical protein
MMMAVPRLEDDETDIMRRMMPARQAPTFTSATWPVRLWCTLLLLFFSGLGCVDLTKPWALADQDGSAAGSPAGGDSASTITSGAGGTGPVSAGGAGGNAAVDVGMGGSTSTSSVALDASGTGGSATIDAQSAADRPQSTGGLFFDAGAGFGGNAGETGRAGSTGAGFDAGAGGAGSGGTSNVGGTTGTGGATGQGGGSGGGTAIPDAAPTFDSSTPDAPCALCAIGTTLVHRYNFNGTGTTVTDSVGTANGTVRNAQLSGQGTLVLAGGTSDQYADMPDRILSTLTSATLELWVTWTGGNNNQRILDFGSSRQSGSNYYAVTTVIVSPNSAPDGTPRLRASYSSDAETSSTFVDAPNTLATGTIQQIVVVFDGQSHTMSMYRNGVLQGQATGVGALSLIDDTNNYLGKSQYTGDPGFGGTYHEFRIYNAALTSEQVQTLYAAGQNASFTQ